MSSYRITATNLSKRYFIRQTPLKRRHDLMSEFKSLLTGLFDFEKHEDETRALWALKSVSLKIEEGERVGIVGRNGAGKSTFLKILSRIIPPTEGEVVLRGRVTSLLEVGTGFNPHLSGRDNVYLNATAHGLSRAEINEKFESIVEFSGVGKFIDTPIKHFSTGMHSRLAFAVAAHLDPDILLMDEVLAVGDIAFQEKCLKRVESIATDGRTVVFVSHDTGSIVRFCDRVIWFEQGQVRFDGDAVEGCELYREEMCPTHGRTELGAQRTGTGAYKISQISLVSSEGQPTKKVRTGDDVMFKVEFGPGGDPFPGNKTVHVCLAIETEHGQRIAGLSSEVTDAELSVSDESCILHCLVRRLPLIPGTYRISVALHLNRQMVDKIVDVIRFTVLDGDFYGTDRLPHNYWGPVCFHYRWSCSEEKKEAPCSSLAKTY